jgi:hypothetical protein
MEVSPQVLLFHFTESKDNMATTYEKIATTTLGSASSTITFNSIAASWTDLRIVLVSVNDASSTQPVEMRFNSDSGTNYSTTNLYGNGGNAGSYRYTNANKMNFFIFYILKSFTI